MADEAAEKTEVPEVDLALVREVREFALPFPNGAEQIFQIEMPKGSKPLRVALKDGAPCLWASVRRDAEVEPRTFFVAHTGQGWPEPAEYLGSFEMACPAELADEKREAGAVESWHVFAALDAIQSLMRSFGGFGGGGLF